MLVDENGLEVVHVARGRTLAQATYEAWKICFAKGVRVRSVKHAEGDSMAYDANIEAVVDEPFGELKIFTPGLPADDAALEAYRLEVVHGIHDHWVGHGWDYTYHDRIAPQIPLIMEKIEDTWLKKARITSRDFLMTTWRWEIDTKIDDPPCLQIVYLRLFPTSVENSYKLNFGVEFRSRDLGNAFWMNAYAFTSWQKYFVRLIESLLSKYGISIGIGRYVDHSKSLHFYGRDERIRHLPRTIERMNNESWEHFSMNTSDYFPEGRLIQIHHEIAAQLEYEKRTKGTEAYSPSPSKNQMDSVGINWRYFPYPKEWDDD